MTLTAAARAEAEALHSPEAEFTLLTITHPSLAGPVRLVDAAVEVISEDPYILGVTSDGEEHYFVPFAFEAPEESETGGGTATLTFPAYDLPGGPVAEVRAALRGLSGPLTVSAAILTTLDLDAPEETFPPLSARVAAVDAERITFELVGETLEREPLSSVSYRGARFPGLDARR